MAIMKYDEDYNLDEPCLSCNKAYVDNLFYEWHCDEKECVFNDKKHEVSCDRNICVSNEYNGIGCDECVVNKEKKDE